MQLSNNQLKEFDSRKIEEFIKSSIGFLKDNFNQWSSDKNESLIREFIISIIKAGNELNILKGINLQKLMHYKIEFGFEIPFHKKLESILKENKKTEDSRVELLYMYIASGRYKLNELFLK